MNKKQFLLIILALFTNTYIFAGSALLAKITEETNVQKKINLFFSVFPDPATTYPSLTQVDEIVTQIFDHTLGLPPTLLRPLQRFYAYLKQRAVNDHLALVIVKKGKKKISLLSALNQTIEQFEIAQLHKDTEMASVLTAELAALNTQKQQEISKLGPKIIDLCRQTKEWQNHLKIFLTNSFTYEFQLLGNINQDEIRMFTSIPHFETAYYSGTYATLRHDAEYVRIFLVMSDILRERVKKQCTDWKELTDLELYDEIEKFKETEFYIFAKQFETISSQTSITPLQHFSLNGSSVSPGYADYLTTTQTPGETPIVTSAPGLDSLFSIKNNVPSLTSMGSFLLNEGTITPSKGAPYPGFIRTKNFDKLFIDDIDGNGRVPSVLFMELLSFNAINLLNQNNSYLFNQANLADTMQRLNQLKITMTSISLFPNIIFYQPEDQLFLEDINILTTQVITPPSIGAAQPTSWWDDVSGFFHGDDDHAIDHAFKKAGNAIKNGLEDTGEDIAKHADLIEKIAETVGITIFAPFLLPLAVTMWTSPKVSGDINRANNSINAALATTVDKIYNDTVKAAKDIWHTAKSVGLDVGDMTVDFATGHFAAGFQQTSDILDDSLSGIEKLGSDAAQAADALVKGIAQIATQVVAVGASILGTVAATVMQDPQLGTDLAGTINAVAKIAIDAIADDANMLIQASVDTVVLSAEAIDLLSKVIVNTTGDFLTGNFKNLGKDIIDPLNQFLHDTVSAVLGMVSLSSKLITDALKNVMVAAAYLTASLTDVINAVAAGVAEFGIFIVKGPEAAAREHASVMELMNKHRRLISAIVGTVLMVAVTVATGGSMGLAAAGLMLALTAGMMIPSIVGSNQQDVSADQELEHQEAFLASFKEYVHQCGPAQSALQQNLLTETSLRLQEQALNADQGLVYYQNYVNDSLNTTRAVQAYQTSSFYNILTTPDVINYPPAGMLPADPGYPYGIETNRMDLNPSQGFRVYNAQRGTFAQEIATLPAPLATNEQKTNSFSIPATTSSLTQHFITQKDLCNFTTSNKTVTVCWRVIYESQGDFYIGIYLNKNYLDTSFLNFLHSNFESIAQNASAYDQKAFDSAWIPLKTFNKYLYNFDHLAQAFVCYKNTDTQNNPALGIYQHLGKGFISENNQPSQQAWFKRGTWYIMTATTTDNQITVAFSQEDNPNIQWKSSAPLQPLAPQDTIPYDTLMAPLHYYPQQSFTGSFGIITSGAAVEYELLTPQQITTQTTQRKISNASVVNTLQSVVSATVELTREQQWIQALEKNINPVFGSWKLTAFSDLTVAQGTYVYATSSTHLSQKRKLTDFVVSLANPPGASAIPSIGMNLLNSSAQLGKALTHNTQYLVSLVTGKCYDIQGNLKITYPDALSAYLQQNSKLPTQLSAAIANATQAYYTAEMGGFVFENVTVTGVIAALKKDVFIYTCPSFTQYLSGLDYLVFVNLSQGGTPGTTQSLDPLSPNNSINCAISLVTGIAFTLTAKNTQAPINQLPSSHWKNITLVSSERTYPETLQTYQSFIDGKTLNTIQHQINAYQTTQKAAQEALIQAQLNPPAPITPPIPALPPAPIPSLANLQALFTASTAGSSGGGGLSFSG